MRNPGKSCISVISCVLLQSVHFVHGNYDAARNALLKV
nr:MAG TPA: hypothetical protein [Caudoviricetes sp.]